MDLDAEHYYDTVSVDLEAVVAYIFLSVTSNTNLADAFMLNSETGRVQKEQGIMNELKAKIERERAMREFDKDDEDEDDDEDNADGFLVSSDEDLD